MRNSPQLSINIPNLCHVDPGPSSVLRVRRSGPRLALRGPVDFPPCNLHRPRSLMAGFWQGVPLRVFARHLWPGQSGPKRVAWPASASRILHSPASCRSAIVSSGTRRNCSHSAARSFNVGTMARAAASSSSRVLSFDGAIQTNRKGMTLIVTTPVINLRSGFPIYITTQNQNL